MKSTVSFTQLKKEDKIDEYIQATMFKRHIPGVAIAVIKNGKVMKEACYGMANVELSVPVTKRTVFEIASMSKQFTCAAIMLLQQDGKLSIQDRISKYLDSLPASWGDIKLCQLMNHTSGVADDWDAENTPYYLENYSDSLMLAHLKRIPLLFKPGESFHYGCGPFILGLIIAKVSGVPYARFMKERIFNPLGMMRTFIYDNRLIVPNRASGYIFEDTVLTNGVDIAPAAEARGDVGVMTCIDDMVKWDEALTDNRILSADSRKVMFTPGTLNSGRYLSYGYGWEIYPTRGSLIIEHGGIFRTGFNAENAFFPREKISVIVLSNLYMEAYASAIAAKVASYYSPQLVQVSEWPLKRDPNADRTSMLQDVLTKVSQKAWSDTEMNSHIYFCGASADMVASLMLKGFKRLVYIDKISSANNPVFMYGEKITETVLYRTDADRTGFWSFGFNDKGKIVFALWEERWGDGESWDASDHY